MDFTITPTEAGAEMSYDKSHDLFNNVYLSLEIIQGSWWFDQGFGLKKRRRLKNTPTTAVLLQQDCRDALQWLLDNGRAASVEVTAMTVPEQRHRLQMRCVLVGIDGTPVTYDKFIEVV